jgi:hypothetical protein
MDLAILLNAKRLVNFAYIAWSTHSANVCTVRRNTPASTSILQSQMRLHNQLVIM